MRWYVAIALALILTFVLRLGLLAYAIYAFAAAVIVSRYLARTWIDSLEATREFNRLTAEIGDTVAVVVGVKNTGKLPVAWVLMEDVLPRDALVQRPPRLKVIGSRVGIATIPPGGTRYLRYQLRFEMRGYYQIGPLVLETGDLFGLHRRYRTKTDPGFVLVYPKVVPLEGYDIASRRPIGEIRMTHRLYEDPTRMAGVRLYQPGDPLSRVHWRATARTATLQSKVLEASSIAGATIVLDFHTHSYANRHEPVQSELAITTAASLANAVYQLGEQIGLVTNGRDAADRLQKEGWALDYRSRSIARERAGMAATSERLQPVVVETRRGVEQLRRILETLARLEKTDGTTFAQLTVEAASRLPRDSTVLAILGDVTPETALALGALRRRGFAVAAVLIVIDEIESAVSAGRLAEQRIDVRHVYDERSLASLCSGQLVG